MGDNLMLLLINNLNKILIQFSVAVAVDYSQDIYYLVQGINKGLTKCRTRTHIKGAPEGQGKIIHYKY